MSAFHEAHFGQHAIASFRNTFIEPSIDKPLDETTVDGFWEEEDDLGYYDDGVKRTLTDEQIEIFRHSELEALRKEEQKKGLSKTIVASNKVIGTTATSSNPCQTPTATAVTLPASFYSNKKKKKKGTKRARPEPKPDLRKRTWDVVDKGLDSLDYD